MNSFNGMRGSFTAVVAPSFFGGLCTIVPKLRSLVSTSFFLKMAMETGVQEIRLI